MDDLIEKLRQQGYGFTKEELSRLGVGWPPPKGWRKRLLRELGLSKEKRPKKPQAVVIGKMPDNGYLHRKTGTGKCHLVVNGRTLCRKPPNWKKEVATVVKPDIVICKVCEQALEEDPQNLRTTRKSGRSFYQSWEWKKLRYETIKRYGPECMCCGSDYRIVVDHIKPLSKYPEMALDPENVQVLCNECNMGKSNDDESDFRPKQDGLTDEELAELELLVEMDGRVH